jgi:hypothetical protein
MNISWVLAHQEMRAGQHFQIQKIVKHAKLNFPTLSQQKVTIAVDCTWFEFPQRVCVSAQYDPSPLIVITGVFAMRGAGESNVAVRRYSAQ